MHRIPYVDPAAWSVESVVTRLEQAEKGLAFYKKISPYEHYINAAWIAARFAAGASPLSIAAWFIGTEGAKRIGGRLFKRRAEAWAKELLEGSVGLVYLHVARIYDPQRVHRGPEWAVLVEALRIHVRIPGVDHNRKLLLDRILRARIPDEFAKMALLRALAGDREPDRRSAPPVDLEQLGARQRGEIAAGLMDLLSEMRGLAAEAAQAAIDDLEGRLGARVVERGAGTEGRPREASWWDRMRSRRRRCDGQESRRPGVTRRTPAAAERRTGSLRRGTGQTPGEAWLGGKRSRRRRCPGYARPDSSFSLPVLSPKFSTRTPSRCSMVSCRLVIGVVSSG